MSLDHVPTPDLLAIRGAMQLALNDLDAKLTELKTAISEAPTPENPLEVLIFSAIQAHAEECEFIRSEIQSKLDQVDCEIIARQ